MQFKRDRLGALLSLAKASRLGFTRCWAGRLNLNRLRRGSKLSRAVWNISRNMSWMPQRKCFGRRSNCARVTMGLPSFIYSELKGNERNRTRRYGMERSGWRGSEDVLRESDMSDPSDESDASGQTSTPLIQPPLAAFPMIEASLRDRSAG